MPLEIAGRRLLGRVVALPTGEPAVNRVLTVSGWDLDRSADRSVLVERNLADHYALHPADRLRALGPNGWTALTVRGVVASAEYLWPARNRQDVFPAPGTFGVIFAAEPVARQLLGDDAQEQVLVRYRDGAPAGTLDRRLATRATALGATATMTRAEQASNATLRLDIDGFRELAVMFPALFLAAAALATAVLLSRRVRAERRLIGTLRANGASQRAVLTHYAEYGLVLALAGGLLGAVAGIAAGRTLTHAYTSALDIPLTVAPAHAGSAAAGLVLALAVGLLAAALPARAAARTAPAVAIRGPMTAARGGPSAAERLLPALGRLPVRLRHVLRSAGRSPRRSVSTLLGVVLATTLVLTSWGMLDTTQVLLDRQFGSVERQDATLQLTGPADAGAVRRIGRVPGVAAAEPSAQLPASLSGPSGRYATALVALATDTTMHGFPDRSALARGLVLATALRSRLGVRAGDRMHVVLGGGEHADLPVSGFTDEPLGSYAYTTLSMLRRTVPQAPPPRRVVVQLTAGADRAATLARLGRLRDVAVVADAQALKHAFDRYLGLFYAFVGAMLVLGAVLAFAIILTTMSANLAERTVEITTLRASGVTAGSVARLLQLENLLLALAGLAIGLPIAVLVARAFMASYSSDLFSFGLALHPWTPVLVAAALVAVALLSQIPGLRALRQVDIARIVRERGE